MFEGKIKTEQDEGERDGVRGNFQVEEVKE